MSEDAFNFVIPAKLNSEVPGSYKIWGLASTSSWDQQGEKVLQEGIDLTPIKEGRGYFNFEHSSAPENRLGRVEGYKQGQEHLYVHGELFKGNPRADAIYAIMKALEDRGESAVGLSIEGNVIERDPLDKKIIKRCIINNISLTMKPANNETYASLMKSLGAATLEFNCTKPERGVESNVSTEIPIFTTSQVFDIIQKALAVSQNYGTTAPVNLSGGSALAQSTLSSKKDKEVEKVDFKGKPIKECISHILANLKALYPNETNETLLEALKRRIVKKQKPGML